MPFLFESGLCFVDLLGTLAPGLTASRSRFDVIRYKSCCRPHRNQTQLSHIRCWEWGFNKSCFFCCQSPFLRALHLQTLVLTVYCEHNKTHRIWDLFIVYIIIYGIGDSLRNYWCKGWRRIMRKLFYGEGERLGWKATLTYHDYISVWGKGIPYPNTWTFMDP